MGRSVDYLRNAERVTYFDVTPETDDILDAELNWDDFISNITYSLLDKYPSLESVEKWDGRETKIFLANELVEIGVSEYMGCASISIRVNEGDYGVDYSGLAINFIDKTWDNMVKVMRDNTYHTALNKMGTFSNGCSVYSAV